MSLVNKSNTYNETAFDRPYWKTDVRLGFDPPEEEENKRREKEWMKQFQKQKQQMKSGWEEYEREQERGQERGNSSPPAVPPFSTVTSPKIREKDEKEREDKKKTAGGGGIGSMLSSAMKPNFKKLVRHGIPSELRAEIWFDKSGACKKKHDNPSVYSKYISQINIDSPILEEIQMDIARTFTMHLMFANQLTKRIMLRILSAFTIRNPNYGYCQNMTFIVGIILFFLPEEDAFWLFTTVMEDILFVDFCSPTMIGLRVDQKVLETLIKERLPKLHAHFVKYSIDVSCFTTSWLLRLFVNVFPIETTLRIWDCFLFEGSKILFRVALAYLKLHEEQMKQCTDSGDVMTFLSSECKRFYDADRLIKACASFWVLRRKQINELRARYIEEFADPADSDTNPTNSNFPNYSNDTNGSESDDDDETGKKGGIDNNNNNNNNKEANYKKEESNKREEEEEEKKEEQHTTTSTTVNEGNDYEDDEDNLC